MSYQKEVSSFLQSWSLELNNPEDLFKIILKLSPLLGNPFPIKCVDLEQTNTNKNIQDNGLIDKKLRPICTKLATKLMDKCEAKLKNEFCMPNKLTTNSKSIDLEDLCCILEKSTFLIGMEATEIKLKLITSGVMKKITEIYLGQLPSEDCDIEEFEIQFLKLVTRVEMLIEFICTVLSSGNFVSSSNQIKDFVFKAILNNLTNQFSMFCEALKPTSKKACITESVENITFLDMFDKADKKLRLNVLLSVAKIIDSYLNLELKLHSFQVLTIFENCQQQKIEKGVLKVRNHIHQHANKLDSSINFSKTFQFKHRQLKNWNWSSALKDIINVLSENMVEKIRTTCDISLEKLNTICVENNFNLITLTSTSNISQNILKEFYQSKYVIKEVGEVLFLICKLVPLAKLGCHDQTMGKLLFSFLDVTNQVMKDIKLFLTLTIEKLHHNQDSCLIYKLLSTVLTINSVLKYCGKCIYEEKKAPFYVSLQIFNRITNQLYQVLVQKQVNFIATKLLQSFTYNNIFKNKKISLIDPLNIFSIQLKLWHTISLEFHKEIDNYFSSIYLLSIKSEVLIDSLRIFINRFCLCNEVEENLSDIAIVLSFTWNFLKQYSNFQSVCNPGSLCLNYQTLNFSKKIILLSNELFTAYILLTCPLYELCEALKITEKFQKVGIYNEFSWITAIDSNKFCSEWKGCVQNMTNKQLSACIIEFLCNNPTKTEFLVHLLNIRKHFFSKKLVSGSIVLPNMELAEVQTLVFFVLLSIDQLSPTILLESIRSSKIVLSERKLIKFTYLKVNDEVRTPWQKVVYQIVMPIAKFSVKLMLNYLKSKIYVPETINFIKSQKKDIKNLILDSTLEDIYKNCVRILLKTLRSQSNALSDNQCNLLIELSKETNMSDAKVEFPFETFGATAIIYAVHVVLSDTSILSHFLAYKTISSTMKDAVKYVSDILMFPNNRCELSVEFDVYIDDMNHLFDESSFLSEVNHPDVLTNEFLFSYENFSKNELPTSTKILQQTIIEQSDDIIIQLLSSKNS